MTTTIIPYDRALPEILGRTPYTRPNRYLEKLGEGHYEIRDGRRPSDMFLVNKLRAAVEQWRDGGYEGAWIIETKGREYEDVAHKDASIRDWCQKISAQTGQTWRYLKVPQTLFDAYGGKTFGGLAKHILGGEVTDLFASR